MAAESKLIQYNPFGFYMTLVKVGKRNLFGYSDSTSNCHSFYMVYWWTEYFNIPSSCFPNILRIAKRFILFFSLANA